MSDEVIASRTIGKAARPSPGPIRTVDDLIRELHRFDPSTRVVIYDVGLGLHREPIVHLLAGPGRRDPDEVEIL